MLLPFGINFAWALIVLSFSCFSSAILPFLPFTVFCRAPIILQQVNVWLLLCQPAFWLAAQDCNGYCAKSQLAKNGSKLGRQFLYLEFETNFFLRSLLTKILWKKFNLFLFRNGPVFHITEWSIANAIKKWLKCCIAVLCNAVMTTVWATWLDALCQICNDYSDNGFCNSDVRHSQIEFKWNCATITQRLIVSSTAQCKRHFFRNNWWFICIICSAWNMPQLINPKQSEVIKI